MARHDLPALKSPGTTITASDSRAPCGRALGDPATTRALLSEADRSSGAADAANRDGHDDRTTPSDLATTRTQPSTATDTANRDGDSGRDDPAAARARDGRLNGGTIPGGERRPGTDRSGAGGAQGDVRRARAHRVHAMLSQDTGDLDAAERHLRAAIAIHRRTGPRRELARLSLDLADLLTAMRRPDDALAVLADGLAAVDSHAG